MKSHDHHVFMQHLLPLAVQGRLPKEVCETLIELSAFFRDLCAKTLELDSVKCPQKQIAKHFANLK